MDDERTEVLCPTEDRQNVRNPDDLKSQTRHYVTDTFAHNKNPNTDDHSVPFAWSEQLVEDQNNPFLQQQVVSHNDKAHYTPDCTDTSHSRIGLGSFAIDFFTEDDDGPSIHFRGRRLVVVIVTPKSHDGIGCRGGRSYDHVCRDERNSTYRLRTLGFTTRRHVQIEKNDSRDHCTGPDLDV